MIISYLYAWKKILKLIDKHILSLVALNILAILFSFVIPSIISDILLMIPFVVAFHAGYTVEKKLNENGTVGGALTLAGAFFINSILVSIFYWAGILQLIAGLYVPAGSPEVIFLQPSTNIILLILDIAMGLLIGFVLGGLGGIAAKKLK